MATEKLYWEDAYMREFSARITSIQGNEVYLDRTAFYPTGGGQPSDMGKLLSGGREHSVLEAKKDRDMIAHVLDDADGLSLGSEVACTLDWARRYAHMRYHTALHIIDGVVQKAYKGGITGGQIYSDRSRMDFDVPGMDREMVQRIIDDAQKVVDSGHKVTARFLTKEEALAIPDLSRTDPGTNLLAGLDKVRVVDIEGFDMQLDGGTHVSNTKEVGRG